MKDTTTTNVPRRLPKLEEIIVNNSDQEDMRDRILENRTERGDVLLVMAHSARAASYWLGKHHPPIHPLNIRVILQERDLRGIKTFHHPRVFVPGYFDQGGLRSLQRWHYLKRRDRETNPFLDTSRDKPWSA